MKKRPYCFISQFWTKAEEDNICILIRLIFTFLYWFLHLYVETCCARGFDKKFLVYLVFHVYIFRFRKHGLSCNLQTHLSQNHAPLWISCCRLPCFCKSLYYIGVLWWIFRISKRQENFEWLVDFRLYILSFSIHIHQMQSSDKIHH